MSNTQTKQMWVSDPCYIIEDYEWPSVLDETLYFNLFPNAKAMREHDASNPRDVQHGVFTLKLAGTRGITCAVSATAHGDGCYPDEEGRSYGVDAGMLGIFPARYAMHRGLDGSTLGHFVDAPADYTPTVSYEDGVIDFGVVRINTGDNDWID